MQKIWDLISLVGEQLLVEVQFQTVGHRHSIQMEEHFHKLQAVEESTDRSSGVSMEVDPLRIRKCGKVFHD